MTHSKNDSVAIMWQELDKKKRVKGGHVTKFNVKNDTTLSVGDNVLIGNDAMGDTIMWRVDDVSDSRPSSLKDYTYVTCECTFIKERPNK